MFFFFLEGSFLVTFTQNEFIQDFSRFKVIEGLRIIFCEDMMLDSPSS